MRPVRSRHGLAAQEIAAARVVERQRIAALLVVGQKPALEVGAPDVVGRVDRLQRRGKGRTAPAWPARLRQPFLAQPVADRAPGRRRLLRKSPAKLLAQLLGTPGGMTLAQRQSRRHQFLITRPAMVDGRAAALLQPLRALSPIPPKPFVAGLPADPELGADLAHHRLVLARRNNKSHPFVHRAGLTPRHRRGPPRRAIDLSTMYPVQSVSDLTGSNTAARIGSPSGCSGAPGQGSTFDALMRRSSALKFGARTF